MLPTQQGAFRLFRLFGIDVFVHFSWFLVAAWRFSNQFAAGGYQSPIFYVAEYLGLFLIVLMHEFGHSLSCRQVGGFANQIVLWPLGGVAYVMPPERPGAQLWSIAAGPLVNVALVPVLWGLKLLAYTAGWDETGPDSMRLIESLFIINLVILIFNLIPVYPLDGGQILRSLLWYVIGRAKSLLVATAIGFVGIVALAFYAFHQRSLWLGIMAYFIFSNCVRGWQNARLLLAEERARG